MHQTIENDNLICTIESKGAEIRSLKNKSTGVECIWQIDQSIWGSSSPVLFPAIGKVKEGKIVFNEKEYTMPKHGIIRHNDQLRFEQLGKSECSFSLTDNKKTLNQYPFKFSFTVKYALINNKLIMSYIIENQDVIPMSFACGGHTAYACPIGENTKLVDYVVEFPKSINLVSCTLGVSGLLSRNTREIESSGGVLTLSDTLFNDDALIFSDIHTDWIRLRKKSEQKGVVVRFSGYPHLALWSKPGAGYVCIEPWLGLPDLEDESLDITKKTSYKTIAPKTTFKIDIETEIE